MFCCFTFRSDNVIIYWLASCCLHQSIQNGKSIAVKFFGGKKEGAKDLILFKTR